MTGTKFNNATEDKSPRVVHLDAHRQSSPKRLEAVRNVVLAFIGMLIIRALLLTIRVRVKFYPEAAQRLFSEPYVPSIVTFWHNRQFFAGTAYVAAGGAPRNVITLISQHRDGRLIARIVRYLGIESVAGSSTRGGATALRALARVIREGKHAAITPDGPKGPIYQCKMGVITLASITGAPIFPLSYASNRKWTFRSWDRMELPKPFSIMHVGVGEPLYVPRDSSATQLEELRLTLEKRLNELTQRLEESHAK